MTKSGRGLSHQRSERRLNPDKSTTPAKLLGEADKGTVAGQLAIRRQKRAIINAKALRAKRKLRRAIKAEPEQDQGVEDGAGSARAVMEPCG